VNLTCLEPDHLDPRAVAGAVAVLEAARSLDGPHEACVTTSSFLAGVQVGWDGEPALAAVVRDELGRVTGVLQVSFPKWDNRHVCCVEVCVDPRDRRQGIGRAVFEVGVARTRAEGRTMVLTESYDCPANVAFAAAVGLERATVDLQRRQDLTTLDWPRLDKEYDAALGHAADYELVALRGHVPPAMVDGFVTLTAAINDAPTDDLDVEDEEFSPERLAAFERMQTALDRRIYRLLARQRSTGALAGVTVVGVEAQQPWQALQYDTSVLREHRGRRLGLLLKIGMLRWLAEQEPQVSRLDTWNAESNDHMVAVNEVLGYQIVARGSQWQRHL
jgi:GNAT superfamily N-acetyltransferase